jgi:TetR/AcrR family transcriptional regulator, transcriptional repressor for nem operon
MIRACVTDVNVYLVADSFVAVAMDMRDLILDSAEARVRAGGYHACSFREIAADVGIKSASVHYHFPTKAELVAALLARCESRVLAAIGDPEDERDLKTKLEGMRTAFLGDDMCLCGVLATETRGLPSLVAMATRHYFVACNHWLSRAFARAGVDQPERKALQFTALLQGAMLQAVSLDDISVFDQAMSIAGDFECFVGASKRGHNPRSSVFSAARRRRGR